MIYLNDDYWNGDDNFNEAPKDDKNGNQNPKSPNDKEPKLGILKIFLIVSSLMLIWTVLEGIVQKASRVPYSEFLTYLKNGNVGSVDINNRSNISYVLKTGEQGTTKIPYDDPTLLGKLNASNVKLTGSDKKISFFELFIAVLPYLFLIYMFSMFYKAQGIGGNIGSFGKSLAREFKPDGKDLIKFSDVAGQKEAKTELEEVVSFLKNPKKFTEIGAKIPKGVLLVGPPGTGKTLIARAVAGEAGVSFLHTSGSDFVEMFVGMGASRVRDLFSEAKKKSPCIIFIDELDAVGRSRGSGLGGGHDEREQTLNQMLVEMDGFETEKGIIVMAATNRADVLDNALLRAGRFDRQVVVDLPDIKEREEILKIHFAKIKADDDINLKTIARATPGCSGADLANLVNEAALLAARFNKVKVTMADLEKARDKILLGIARESKVLTPEEKTATAYHEAGHALLHYYVKGVDPLHKVTIIPHGRALGLTMSLPEKDVTTRNRDNLLGWIKITMGGYVAEDLVYGQTTTGTSNDIQQATNIATKMVTEWGMSSLGFVNYATDEQPLFFGRELASRKNFSESTADKIDLEVRKILDDCLNDVKKILTEHRDQLDKLSRRLVDRETLDDKEIRELLGFEPLEEKPLEG